VSILAFSLIGDEVSAAGGDWPGFVPYTISVGRSAIFGGQTVVHDLIADLLPIRMPISLGTTEFEFTSRRALDAYYEAYAAAAEVLTRETRIRPARVQTVLQAFHDRVIATIKKTSPAVTHLRVSIIRPFGQTSFRVVNSFNMVKDADDRLNFSTLVPGAPNAFRTRTPAFIDFAPIAAAGINPGMTKYELASLRKSLKSAICFPVFATANAWKQPASARPLPRGVVSIDSDHDLAQIFADKALLESLALMSVEVNAVLDD
jgi:hypothetical protein